MYGRILIFLTKGNWGNFKMEEKTKTIGVYLPISLAEKVEEEAEKQWRSSSSFVKMVIREWFEGELQR